MLAVMFCDGLTICRKILRAAVGNASPVPSPRRRRRVVGFGEGARGVIALTTARNSALMVPVPLASVDILSSVEIRGWFSIPPAGASSAAGLSRVFVTSIPRAFYGLLDRLAVPRPSRLFCGLGVGDLDIFRRAAFGLARVGGFARRLRCGFGFGA